MKSFEFLSEAPTFTPGGETKRVSGNMPNIRKLPDSSNIYTVNSGDSLEGLCKRFDTTPEGLEWLNPGLDIKIIKPGTKIRVRGDEKRSSTVDSPASGGAKGNAKIALDFFIQQGWTPEQAAGLVANLQAESGQNLDPNIFD